jgi:hypothetical protein
VHFVLPASDWPNVHERLLPLARLAEKQVLEWDRSASSAAGLEAGSR